MFLKKISAGKNTLTLVIKNAGINPINELEARLELQNDSGEITKNKDRVPVLEPNQEKEFFFEADADDDIEVKIVLEGFMDDKKYYWETPPIMLKIEKSI